MKHALPGSRQGILLAIILLAGFLFITVMSVYSYFLTTQGALYASSPLVKYHVFIMVGMATLGVATGAAVFYIMSRKVEEQQQSARANAAVLLQFLSTDERAVVNKLLASNGSQLQSELSRMHGMTRVKAHRTVMRLSTKDVVDLEQYGKTRSVKLKQEIFDALQPR